jgi:hypothetical protein
MPVYRAVCALKSAVPFGTAYSIQERDEPFSVFIKQQKAPQTKCHCLCHARQILAFVTDCRYIKQKTDKPVAKNAKKTKNASPFARKTEAEGLLLNRKKAWTCGLTWRTILHFTEVCARAPLRLFF